MLFRVLFCLLVGLFVFENHALTGELEEDQAWLDNEFTSVYKSGLSRFPGESGLKIFLQEELQLHSKPPITRASHELIRNASHKIHDCAHIFRKVRKDSSAYNNADGGREFHMRYLPIKYLPKVPEFPRTLFLKIIDALKELGQRGYVLVESGIMYREGVHWDRTGVMPRDTFIKLGGLEAGHNLTGSHSIYEFQGRSYVMDTDLVMALNFFNFTDSYDVTTRSWRPKYKEGSLEAVIITKTNDLIAGYDNYDPYFQGGPYVRAKISDNIKPILLEAAIKDPEHRKSFVEDRIQETVTGLMKSIE